METNRKNYSSEGGFTLIELLIAVVLIVVGLLAYGVFTGNLVVQNTKSERKSQAATYAQEKLEDFKNQALSAVLITGTGTDNPDTEAIYTRNWTITGSGGNPTSIRVTVSWVNNAGQNLNISYKTIISQ